jgi:hypothetical protein
MSEKRNYSPSIINYRRPRGLAKVVGLRNSSEAIQQIQYKDKILRKGYSLRIDGYARKREIGPNLTGTRRS